MVKQIPKILNEESEADMENAKTIFTSLSDKARKAELAKRQLQELKTMAAKCTPVMHLAPSGSGGESRTLEDNVLRIEAAEKELQAIIADYVAAKLRVMELIRMLPDTCQQVMQLRFVEGYTKKQISEKLYISETSIKRIVREALQIADTLLPEMKVGP